MLKFFSGMSGSVNSRRAMRECLEIAMGDKEQFDADLIIFHTSIGHNFKELLDEARLAAPKARIAGCSCAGIIGKEGANESMKTLAIMVVKGDRSEWYVAHTDNIRGHNSYDQAVKMASQLKEQTPNANMVLLLASGIDIAADRAIDGIESVFGTEIKIFGGTSSDNMRAISSFQFLDDQIFERGAVLIGFADPSLEVEMGVHHGSVPVGTPFEVTRAEANRIYELDGKPAWHMLMDRLGQPHDPDPGPMLPLTGLGQELSSDLHEEYNNKLILRCVVKTEPDGSFYFPVDAQAGTKFWLTERDEDLIFDGLEMMMEKLKERLNGRVPVAVFHTDCGARGRFLFNRVLKDEIVSHMQSPLCGDQDVPWLGMYGFGEFAQLGGHNWFHNYTTSLYCLVKKQ